MVICKSIIGLGLFIMGIAGVSAAEEGVIWKAFALKKLAKEQSVSGQPYLSFLDEASMKAGLYVLPSGDADQQKPHDLDEIYYVTKGSAAFEADGERVAVQAGSLIYVKAGVPHKFVAIEQKLEILVVFPKTDFSLDDPDWQINHIDDIRKGAKPDENVWDPFLNVSTMMFGLYMLPLNLGGDQSLTHKMDEINIVTRGTAKFRMDDNEITVGPGSIMWVQEGIGHYFHDLSEDFDVLILFHKKTQDS